MSMAPCQMGCQVNRENSHRHNLQPRFMPDAFLLQPSQFTQAVDRCGGTAGYSPSDIASDVSGARQLSLRLTWIKGH